MDFELKNVVWQGPDITDDDILDELPEDLQWLLGNVNGFIQFSGGLHLRGACAAPEWHALRAAWRGDDALHRVYRSLTEADIPFAQDYLGNQFILRGDEVLRLNSETGVLTTPLKGLVAVGAGDAATSFPVTLQVFLMFPQKFPQSLELELLDQFCADGGALEAGELLHVYPPLCSREAQHGVSVKPMPVAERLAFLAKVARKVQSLGEGEAITFPLTR